MKKLIAVAGLAFAASAFATVTTNETTHVITFDVESGDEAYNEAIGSDIAGIVKTGAGKIVLSVVSSGFTGKTVLISEGVLEIQHKDALGSGNTVTVANGAQYRFVYNATQSDCSGQNNDIVLQGGAGPDNNGALYGTGNGSNSASDTFWGNVTLEADATIGCGAARGFGKDLDLGGNTLTIKGPMRLAGGTAAGKIVTVKNPGKIRLASGTICIQGAPVFNAGGVFEAAGGGIQMWNVSVPVAWPLHLTDANLTLNMGRGLVGGQSANPNANVWAGNVEIASGRTLTLTGNNSYKTDYLSIAGNITGDGGVSIGGSNAEFRLSGTNTYSGGTTIGANSLRIFADDSVSTNGPVRLSGGVLELHLEDAGITSEYVSGLAGAMSESRYSSGSGRLRFITGAAQDVTLTSDFSTMHPSISIWHEGMGSLTLNGEMISSGPSSGAMLRNTAGTLVLDGDCNRWLWSFNCFGGTMDVAGGSLWRAYNNGKLDFRVGDSNDVSNARMRILNGGTLYFPSAGGDASETIKVDDLGTKPAILEIYDGATVTAKVQVAYAERSLGAVYQYGGDVFHLTRPGNDGAIGNFGQAYWWMEGGTFKSDNANPYLGLASKTGSESQFEVQGGTFSLSGANSLMICRGGASNAEYYMGGGTATIGQIRMGGELTYAADKGADAGGLAVLTLAGTNNPMLTVTSSLRMTERTNEFTSVVNLNAGTLVANTIYDVNRASGGSKDCKSYLNFNGGTLKFATSGGPFDASVSHRPTRTTVYGGGASIEMASSSGRDSLIKLTLLRPTGRGIKSITVPAAAAATGYAMPPVVKISGGGGENATAHVRFDPRTGTIDRDIEVTSPGINFETAPTVTITAPDMKTPVVCDVELTEGEQEDGGVVLKGGGQLLNWTAIDGGWAFMTNLTGAIVVGTGITFYPQVESVPNPFSANKELRMAGGAYSAWKKNPSWRRVGGYGRTRSWDNTRLDVTEALFFRAQDLEQGLYLTQDAGSLNLVDGCVVEVDDFSALTQDRYTLVTFEGTGKLPTTPQLPAEVAREWSVRYLSGSKMLILRRRKNLGLLINIR